MRRLLTVVAVLVIVVVGLAAQAGADPSSPLNGRWLGQDSGVNAWGTTDESNVTLVITPGGRYRVTDDAASICEDRAGAFVRVRISGFGTFSPDGNTFTTNASDIVYCRTAAGWIDTGPVGGTGIVFVFNVGTGRIADSGGAVNTCWWRTGSPQPAACLP